ncbi:MAG TPA: FAD-dependent oxidoreductase [Bacillota bacterium]|nr:FAD-dependent oxidoreductase [Bacillota bacterium]
MGNYDVVVIGGGGAGLVAAVAAAREGVRVALLHKTQPGFATCTAYAGGGFSLAYGQVSPTEHYRKTLETGRGINRPDLLGVLCEQGGPALTELKEWGISIRMSERGHASVSSSARTPIMGGGGLTAELTALAARVGVDMFENTMATRLEVNQGEICGVHTFNWRSNRTTYLPCRTAILAGGGGGAIYRNTDNPVRITGDTYALALQAGLSLTDMEFVQFYPLGWKEPAFPCWMIGLPIIDHVRVTDEDGRPFLHEALSEWGLKNGREANLYARDRSARLIGQRLQRGKVLLHLQEVPDDSWDKSPFKEMRRFYPEGTDPRSYGPISVGPVEHYFTGGVVIDEHCRTEIGGLYACGETTGGVDGASRIGGNALTNIVVFGLRAGRHAAALQRDISEAVVEPEPAPHPGSGMNIVAARNALRDTVQQGLGPVRDKTGIENAIVEIENLRQQLSSFAASTPYEVLLLSEMPGMLLTALSVAKAALLREESRGVHYRTDFPDELPSWQKSTFVTLQGGEINARCRE